MHGNKIILKGKKYRRHYLLTRSSAQDGVPSMSESSMWDGVPYTSRNSARGKAPDVSRLDIRWETWEDDRRYRRVKFLLSQEAISSNSQIKQVIAYEGDVIKRPGSISTFAYPWAARHLPIHEQIGICSRTWRQDHLQTFKSYIETKYWVEMEIIEKCLSPSMRIGHRGVHDLHGLCR